MPLLVVVFVVGVVTPESAAGLTVWTDGTGSAAFGRFDASSCTGDGGGGGISVPSVKEPPELKSRAGNWNLEEAAGFAAPLPFGREDMVGGWAACRRGCAAEDSPAWRSGCIVLAVLGGQWGGVGRRSSREATGDDTKRNSKQSNGERVMEQWVGASASALAWFGRCRVYRSGS